MDLFAPRVVRTLSLNSPILNLNVRVVDLSQLLDIFRRRVLTCFYLHSTLREDNFINVSA